jgi:serine/threonine protein kinase
MISFTGNTTMFYCPKCSRTYEEGTQRFCDNDGGRLLPAPAGQRSDLQSGGVFSNLLGKTQPPDKADKKNNLAPRLIPVNKTEESDKKQTSFRASGRIFQSEQFLKPKTEDPAEAEDSILELEPPPRIEASGAALLEFDPILDDEPLSGDLREELPKPLPRLIKPGEIASGTASVGDRRTNPLGREALSWENLEALVGQTVKGRYRIIEELEPDDEDSVIYLAEDKIVAGKRVVVRVFMNDGLGADDFEEKIFAEERIALSHLNHPNIAGVFDSGELPEGSEFIVSEFVEGKSLAEILRQTGQLHTLRTARIIRQASYALSEAHQNGILHRNLKPENLRLTVSEAGIEQVKLMNFGVSHGEITDSNLAYKAPEEIENGASTYASDIYALAVIAYQMLTARLPFPAETESVLFKAQKAGLMLPPTNLRLDIQPLADEILEKAFAFNPSERYPKARDFGDAFFNALTTVAPWTNDEETENEPAEPIAVKREFFVVPAINRKNVTVEESAVEADFHISPGADKQSAEITASKTRETADRAKQAPAPPEKKSVRRGWLAVLGAAVLLAAIWGISRLSPNTSNRAENSQTQSIPAENISIPGAEKTPANSLTSGDAPDVAPEPRLQKAPLHMRSFQNRRENLKGELAKNFLGFEIFYPPDWKLNDAPTNFLDISKSAADGFPVEQMLVTRYESRGTMTLDRENFPKLVEKSNQDLKKSLGESFKVVSEGETTIQNGRWKVYEVKFQSTGKNEKGEKITLWGRRLWLPVQRAGVQNGFVITLLATSLSDTVKSVDEVGVQGELANVLDTFEPAPR